MEEVFFFNNLFIYVILLGLRDLSTPPSSTTRIWPRESEVEQRLVLVQVLLPHSSPYFVPCVYLYRAWSLLGIQSQSAYGMTSGAETTITSDAIRHLHGLELLIKHNNNVQVFRARHFKFMFRAVTGKLKNKNRTENQKLWSRSHFGSHAAHCSGNFYVLWLKYNTLRTCRGR